MVLEEVVINIRAVLQNASHTGTLRHIPFSSKGENKFT